MKEMIKSSTVLKGVLSPTPVRWLLPASIWEQWRIIIWEVRSFCTSQPCPLQEIDSKQLPWIRNTETQLTKSREGPKYNLQGIDDTSELAKQVNMDSHLVKILGTATEIHTKNPKSNTKELHRAMFVSISFPDLTVKKSSGTENNKGEFNSSPPQQILLLDGMFLCYTHIYGRQIVLMNTKYGKMFAPEEVDSRKNAKFHQYFGPGWGIWTDNGLARRLEGKENTVLNIFLLCSW